MNRLGNTTETHGLLVLSPQQFQNMPTRSETIRSGTRLSALTATNTVTSVGLKRVFTDINTDNAVEITLKLQGWIVHPNMFPLRSVRGSDGVI